MDRTMGLRVPRIAGFGFGGVCLCVLLLDV